MCSLISCSLAPGAPVRRCARLPRPYVEPVNPMQQFYNSFMTPPGGVAANQTIGRLCRPGPPGALRGRKTDGEGAALSQGAFDMQPAAMAIEDMLDDGQPQSGAAAFPTALHIDTIKTLGQARDRLAGDSLPVILDGSENLSQRIAPALAGRAPEMDAHRTALAAIFDRVVDQVLEHLDQLVAIADGALAASRTTLTRSIC